MSEREVREQLEGQDRYTVMSPGPARSGPLIIIELIPFSSFSVKNQSRVSALY